jgi:hypothetical protein
MVAIASEARWGTIDGKQTCDYHRPRWERFQAPKINLSTGGFTTTESRAQADQR